MSIELLAYRYSAKVLNGKTRNEMVAKNRRVCSSLCVIWEIQENCKKRTSKPVGSVREKQRKLGLSFRCLRLRVFGARSLFKAVKRHLTNGERKNIFIWVLSLLIQIPNIQRYTLPFTFLDLTETLFLLILFS